jgi:PPOX class probable FMN-dependent enzyme
MIDYIDSLDELLPLYGPPSETATRKLARRLTPEYARWIAAAPFCTISTVGPEGTDCSPRGDEGPVVRILDETTLALPDWNGNNRIDTLRNIVADGRVSLMFMVPGSTLVVRVNGRARITADADLRDSFARGTLRPRTVVVIALAEVYFQCSRALVRSALWTRTPPADLPTPGQIMAGLTEGAIGGAEFDRAWPDRIASALW